MIDIESKECYQRRDKNGEEGANGTVGAEAPGRSVVHRRHVA